LKGLIVALSRLRGAVESRQLPVPHLSDLHDAGAIR
jgi:hypothetical protein